jgi:DNA-binding NarL/FixJ family response regulator
LVEILKAQPDFTVVGEAANGAEAITLAHELSPDLTLMDLSMPGTDGLTATRLLGRDHPQCTIVILTVRDDREDLFEAIRAGAHGYLLKTMRAAQILGYLRGLRNGEPAIAPALARYMVEEFRRLAAPVPDRPAEQDASLTYREQEVITLVAQGKSDKEIAKELSLSVYTVKAHMRNVLAKLHVSGRREAARYVRRPPSSFAGGSMDGA